MMNEPVKYDLSRVTAREMQAFFSAARANDVETLARTLAKVVVSCPYGTANDPETYLDLPFYGEFQAVIDGMVSAAKAHAGN